MLLQSFIILTGSVMLGGFVQGVASQTRAVRYGCHSFTVLKTFYLRDPTTNERCTLKIPNVVCGGFCETETELISKNFAIDPKWGAYRLSPVPNCKCCDLIQHRLHTVRAMTLTCVEGQKWNQTFEYKIPARREQSDRVCGCRTCTSSATVSPPL